MSYIFINRKSFNENDSEFVERKGIGHPDTLADALAEKLSAEYSKFTLKNYGAILHHNFDKVGLLGGASYVSFGKGYLTKPIRILLNGRASTKFAKEKIPIRKLLTHWASDFFKEKFPMINVVDDLELHFNLSNQSSPGKTYEKESKQGKRKYWFEPRGLCDLQELKKPLANDTSLGVGYAPYSNLEKTILEIELRLNSNFKNKHKWIGSDIKIMGFRNLNDYYFTICIPQIANFVSNLEEYKNNLRNAREFIENIIKKHQIHQFELNINTRDDYNSRELYLTAIGSSIESGDEGLVGRGNRINGVIAPCKPLSMEGSCGKNPIYHIGKVYYLAANEIAKKIYQKLGIKNEVFIASQSGRYLLDPWIIVVNVPNNFVKDNILRKIIIREINSISNLTKRIINNKFKLF